MYPSSFLPAALPPLHTDANCGNVFPDCNCNMLKHVFMISKICRWRLHNPLVVLIIEQMRRILKCTSKLFHAHFTSVMREAPANFWVLNSITRLIQSREHECRAGRSPYIFFQRHVPRVSNTGCSLCFFLVFFLFMSAIIAHLKSGILLLRVAYATNNDLANCGIRFLRKRYNTNYFVPLVHVPRRVHCCS